MDHQQEQIGLLDPTPPAVKPSQNQLKKPGKPKGKKLLFTQILTIYAAVLAGVVVISLGVLWDFLANYERSLPQKVAEQFVADQTISDWGKVFEQSFANDFESEESISKELEKAMDKKQLVCRKTQGEYTDEKPTFTLKNKEHQLVKMTLAKGKKGRYGFDRWKVSDCEFVQSDLFQKIQVSVPASGKVYINDTLLDQTYVTKKDTTYCTEKTYVDQFENPVTWTEYTVGGLLSTPQITVEAGGDFAVEQIQQQDGTTRYNYTLKQEQKDAYKNDAQQFIKSLIYYHMMGEQNFGANVAKALSFTKQGSLAFKNINATRNGVIYNASYPVADYSNIHADSVVVHADNCFSIDVSYEVNAKTSNGAYKSSAKGTYRIYYMPSGNGFEIVSFELV